MVTTASLDDFNYTDYISDDIFDNLTTSILLGKEDGKINQSLHHHAHKLYIPHTETLNVLEWMFLLLTGLIGLVTTMCGMYFTYMHRHGKDILFQDKIEEFMNDETLNSARKSPSGIKTPRTTDMEKESLVIEQKTPAKSEPSKSKSKQL